MGTVTALNEPDPGFHERGEALANEITELCSYLYAAEYQLLVKIREFDENGYWGGPGLMSCAHWLNFKCGMGMNAARERVRVARALASLPKVSAAFNAGTLSYSKVRAMTRVATPANNSSTPITSSTGAGAVRPAWIISCSCAASTIASYTRVASAARGAGRASSCTKTPESGPCRTGRSCRGATRRTRPSTTCTSASITWASRLIPACRTGMPAIPATGKWLWKGCWRVKRGKLMKYSTGGRMVQRLPCPGT